MTIDGDSRQGLCIRFNQYLTVLGQHVFSTILHPVGIVVSRLFTWNVGIISLLISIIVTLPSVVVAFAILDAYIEFTVFITHGLLTLALVSTIHITDIAATEDIAVLPCQLLRCAHCTSVNTYLSLSEDITVGIERTAFSKIVIATTTTKDVTMYVTFIQFHIGLTSLVNTLQFTYAVILTTGFDNAATYRSNLTTTKESVTDVSAIHLYVGDIHTTVVDIAATEDTSTVIQTVCTVAYIGLVVQFLLIEIGAYLYILEVFICCRHGIEVTITNKAFIERNVSRTKYGTALTATVGVTINGRNTIDKTGAVELTYDDMRLTEDVICCGITNFSSMITYTTLPTATIDVTGRTTLNIGIGRSNESIVEIVS